MGEGVKSGTILISLNFESTVENHKSRIDSAATTIQAGYKGMVAKQDKKLIEEQYFTEGTTKILDTEIKNDEDRTDTNKSNFIIQDVTSMNNEEYYQQLKDKTDKGESE